MSQRFERSVKALLLLALAVFLYSRFANGTLYFYINRNFMAFTLLAVFGLLVVGLSYRFDRQSGNPPSGGHDDHAHAHTGHETGHESGHEHSHGLTWGNVVLVLLPIVFGLLVPPQPLGASALANREVNSGVNQNSLPGVVGITAPKATTDMNILDWWTAFQRAESANTDHNIVGQPARVAGFVYKDEKYGDGNFLLVRYVVSCCVADASALGLLVASPQSAQLDGDQWVEVTGAFAPGELDDWQLPVLVADHIETIEAPNQPYLYP